MTTGNHSIKLSDAKYRELNKAKSDYLFKTGKNADLEDFLRVVSRPDRETNDDK